MSLTDHYQFQNAQNGHDANCSFGAGADCDCSVLEALIENKRVWYRELRADYRKLGKGEASWEAMEAKVAAKSGDWLDPRDEACAYVEAAQALLPAPTPSPEDLRFARMDEEDRRGLDPGALQ